MAPPRRSPFSNPTTPPVVAPVPVCTLGQRCHVNGKGIRTFGTKFPLALVQKIASSCITLVGDDTFSNPPIPNKKIASGVLIAPEVALFAAHSINTIGASGVKVLMGFECDAATAPPGMFFQYRGNWPSCTPLATATQAVGVKTLESGNSNEFDYEMVLIKWNSGPPVKLPRIPDFPKPGFVFSDEMLLVGHPDDPKTIQGQETQACAFKLVKTRGPNPSNVGDPITDDVYGYGEFGFTRGDGFSGGGVFNDKGEIVGLLKGNGVGVPGMNPNNFCFLNLGLAAGKMQNDPRRGRLRLWFDGKSPLKSGDGGSNPPPTFTT